MRVKFYLACLVGALVVDNADASKISSTSLLNASSMADTYSMVDAEGFFKKSKKDKKIDKHAKHKAAKEQSLGVVGAQEANAAHDKKSSYQKAKHMFHRGAKELNARSGASVSSVSRFATELLTGNSAFTMVAREYSDYCAMYSPKAKERPVSFLEFIHQVRFPHALGDYYTFKHINVDILGEKDDDIDIAYYMKQREASRGKAAADKAIELENMAQALVDEMLQNKKKPEWAEAITPWTANLILRNKDNPNPQLKKPFVEPVVPKETQAPVAPSS